MGKSYKTQNSKKTLTHICKLCKTAVSEEDAVRVKDNWICYDCSCDIENNEQSEEDEEE